MKRQVVTATLTSALLSGKVSSVSMSSLLRRKCVEGRAYATTLATARASRPTLVCAVTSSVQAPVQRGLFARGMAYAIQRAAASANQGSGGLTACISALVSRFPPGWLVTARGAAPSPLGPAHARTATGAAVVRSCVQLLGVQSAPTMGSARHRGHAPASEATLGLTAPRSALGALPTRAVAMETAWAAESALATKAGLAVSAIMLAPALSSQDKCWQRIQHAHASGSGTA